MVNQTHPLAKCTVHTHNLNCYPDSTKRTTLKLYYMQKEIRETGDEARVN